ncbi:MAG: hypothetical protein WBM00_07000, partial [Solirubrobacterales bacterium]
PEERDDPAVEGAAEQIREEPQHEQRQPWRDQREEEDEAADSPTLPARTVRNQPLPLHRIENRTGVEANGPRRCALSITR